MFPAKKKHGGLGLVSTSVALQFAKDVQDVKRQIGKSYIMTGQPTPPLRYPPPEIRPS